METARFLARDEKGYKIEIKTGRGRLTIVLAIYVWVTNLSSQQWNKKLVIEW